MKKILILFCFFWSFPKAFCENGVSDTEVIFGQSAAFKGPSAALGSNLWMGSELYFHDINSKGGVNGRKIKIISRNTI